MQLRRTYAKIQEPYTLDSVNAGRVAIGHSAKDMSVTFSQEVWTPQILVQRLGSGSARPI